MIAPVIPALPAFLLAAAALFRAGMTKTSISAADFP